MRGSFRQTRAESLRENALKPREKVTPPLLLQRAEDRRNLAGRSELPRISAGCLIAFPLRGQRPRLHRCFTFPHCDRRATPYQNPLQRRTAETLGAVAITAPSR